MLFILGVHFLSLEGKIRILTFQYNRPDFVEYQYLVLSKFLKDDFELVPYINGLDELLEQKYAVFVTDGPGKNIVFSKIL